MSAQEEFGIRLIRPFVFDNDSSLLLSEVEDELFYLC
jgi:hypothetical protein